MYIGLKNISSKPYTAKFDGVDYDFKEGEIKVVPIAVSRHLVEGSSMTATGKKALVVIENDKIPDEIRKAPEVVKFGVVMLKNISGVKKDVTWDGMIHSFSKDEVKTFPFEIASKLIKSSIENGKPWLVEGKAEPVAEKPVFNKKDGIK